MGRKLSNMTWKEVRGEMSIAGDPEKVVACCKVLLDEIVHRIDTNNAAELINLELGLQRIQAEVRIWKRLYEGRTGQKIS